MYRHIHHAGKPIRLSKQERHRMATIFARQALLAKGWARDVRLTMHGGMIDAIETGVVPLPGDEVQAVVLPGMPNLHSHAFQRAFAGRAERRGASTDDFWSWREAMYATALAMSPEDVEAVATQLYIEMLEAGFTRVGEFHYLHHAPDGAIYADIAEMAGRIASAAGKAGIGLTLLPVFYAHGGFNGQEPHAGQRRFITNPGSFARLMDGARRAVRGLEGARVGIAPHSLRAVTADELREILPLAEGAPIHIHVAEQVKEVEDCLAAHGMRPVERLLELATLDRYWCLIHATHMTAGETLAVARSGAVAGLCPITEANLGDGLFNASPFLAAGGAFGIGSDSNVEISLGGELRILEYGQRLALRARNVLASPGGSTGARLFRAALEGGAEALGAGQPALAEGTAADLVTLRSANPDWDMPQGDDILDTLIFAPGSLAIDRVLVRGETLVEGGRHRARESVASAFGKAMRGLRQHG
jgi:formiminoglutamate deiminase